MQLDANTPPCGPWHLVREIGHGAYGTVHLAERSDGARAAVKVCRRDDIGEERYERELRGAKLYSAVPPQEGLVRIRELVEEDWGFYAVMDLADNEFGRDGMVFSGRAASPFAAASAEYRPKTLARVVEGEKALPLGESVKLGIALAKGLAALQRHHLLHRDIKPGNVIYVGGRPVLSDPGLVVEESEAASFVGTLGYVPPENFTAAAGDIYSLGLTLKAASFGRCIEDLDKGPALEADTGAKLFPAWWRILNKATDPTPSRRYQSAKALLKDLESLRRQMAVAAIVGSRLAKVVLALAVIGVAAVVVLSVSASRHAKEGIARQSAEVGPLKEELAKLSAENKILKEKITSREEQERAMVEKTMQSAKWHILEIQRSGMSLAKMHESNLRDRIDAVAATNATRAAELQVLVDKMITIGKRDDDLRVQIKGLRAEAKRKHTKGQSDEKEFQRAEELDKERKKSYGEINSIYDELRARLK